MAKQSATNLSTFQSSNAPKPSLGFLSPLLGLIECVALLLVALLIWLMFNGSTIATFLLVPVLLLAFIPYFVAVYVCAHPQALTTVRAVLFFTVVFRLIFLGTPPELSDDIHRYIWEGRAQNHGYNPYVYAPNAAELEPLRDDNYRHINHPEIPAIYPPFAQLLFSALALLPQASGYWLGLFFNPLTYAKFLFGGIDCLNVWLLVLILRERKLPHQFALIYGWNPLPALEFAGSGHMLTVAISLFLATCLLVQRNRQVFAAISAGLAFSMHFLIVAPLLHAYNALDKRWLPVVAIVFVASYVPFLSAGVLALESITHYAAMWKFNDSLFGLIAWPFRETDRASLGSGIYLAYKWPKVLCGAVWLGTALWFIFRQKEWLRAGYLMTGMMLLLSATVHPWYVTLILPFLCFYRNLGWLAFTALVTISYSAVAVERLTGAWPAITLFPTREGLELYFIGWLEYAPFFVLFAWGAFRRKKETRS